MRNDHGVAIWCVVDSWILGLCNAHCDQRGGWVGRRGHGAAVAFRDLRAANIGIQHYLASGGAAVFRLAV